MKRIIFIIGMGRSGTSLLASCLAEQGYSIGVHQAFVKNWQNPNGYYENEVLLNMHEKMLRYNKSNWYTIPNKMRYPPSYVTEYRKILDKEFADTDKILIKDPRLTFFTHFIKEVCRERYKYKLIFSTRDKTECCKSLAKAQSKPLDKMVKLYNRTHAEKIIGPYMTTNHHDLLFNHDETMKKISDYCGINYETNTDVLVDLKLYRNRNVV